MNAPTKPLRFQQSLAPQALPSKIPTGPASLTPLFSTIPPERVGLNGEYDYNGLAKRVALTLNRSLDLVEIKHLYVSQRGRVVIFKGKVPDLKVLAKSVTLAKQIAGTIDVETNRVIVGDA